jgi:hypothetical protein
MFLVPKGRHDYRIKCYTEFSFVEASVAQRHF